MGFQTLIFPSCKELARRLSSGEYERAPWYVRLGVRWHLYRCQLCEVYARQVRLLGEGYRRSVEKGEPADPELKKRLTERLRGR